MKGREGGRNEPPVDLCDCYLVPVASQRMSSKLVASS